MALQNTMKAVVFDGPYKVSLQDRPVPASMILPPVSLVVTSANKLLLSQGWPRHHCQSTGNSALRLVCFSFLFPDIQDQCPAIGPNKSDHVANRPLRELHVYRGHQPSGTGFIMGHEFTGVVAQTGSDVKSFKVGDKVVSPFTVNW